MDGGSDKIGQWTGLTSKMNGLGVLGTAKFKVSLVKLLEVSKKVKKRLQRY